MLTLKLIGLVLLLIAFGVASNALKTLTPEARAETKAETLIDSYASAYGVDPDWLLAVARCETGGTLRADLVGAAGERGVFQWHPKGVWWETPAGRAGEPIPAGNINRDIEMAAWAFANGYARSWTCARLA